MKTQSKYVVYVINKLNNEEALSHLEFDTLEKAMSIAQHIILRSFSQEGKEGYEEWLKFGEDAIILTPTNEPLLEFSGQALVKKFCGIK